MGSHGAFWWSCTGWRRGAPAWFTWISWLGAAPAAGGVQAQGLGSSRPLRIQGVAPCVLSTDNPPDRRQEVMRGAGWARASNLRDLYACGWTSQPAGCEGGGIQGPTCCPRRPRDRGGMIQPHKKCCGCCCSLQIGCIIGCSLFILLFGMSIGASFSGRQPNPVLARSFCQVRPPCSTCLATRLATAEARPLRLAPLRQKHAAQPMIHPEAQPIICPLRHTGPSART